MKRRILVVGVLAAIGLTASAYAITQAVKPVGDQELLTTPVTAFNGNFNGAAKNKAFSADAFDCSDAPGAVSGSAAFVNGVDPPPPLGSGAYKMSVDATDSRVLSNQTLEGQKLSSITALRYSEEFTSDANDSVQAPYLTIGVDTNGDGTRDDTLFFEPAYQNGTYAGAPDQGPVKEGIWQTWDVKAGAVRSNNTEQVPSKTFAQYLAAHPNAKLRGTETGGGAIRLAVGCGNQAIDAYVDHLVLSRFDYDLGL
jgi:hypothetical protein